MVQDLVEIISETQGMEYDLAMRSLFDSEIYNKIIDVETVLYYREGEPYVFGLFQDMIDCGRVILLRQKCK